MLQVQLIRFQELLAQYPPRVVVQTTKLEQKIASLLEQITKLEGGPSSEVKFARLQKLKEDFGTTYIFVSQKYAYINSPIL